MENRLIVERLKQEASTADVAECVVQMFIFEVENAPKKKPHFKELFTECVNSVTKKAQAATEHAPTGGQE